MDEHPARDVESARSSIRRTWTGHGRLVREEKDAVGLFLHDLVRVFGGVSVPAVPALFYVTGAVGPSASDLQAGALVGWLALVVTATLVCGGWVGVPLTERPGWLSLSLRPSVIGVRLVVFNAAVLVAAAVGAAVAAVAGAAVAAGVALLVGVTTALGVPALAERVYDAVEG